MLILGIETSCDDTACAVLNDTTVLASQLSSQDIIHSKYGGVVPELASRKHLQNVCPVVDGTLTEAGVSLDDIDLIAATRGPGLIGSLLVGYCYAKSLAFVKKKKFVGVDHMAGHILSVFLENRQPKFPFVSLIVSGGTSSLFLAKSYNSFELLGQTRDDAAGEAYDKVAKLLGLPYPGGPHIAKRATTGNARAITFPRAWLDKGSLDFSFSGLKTAVLNYKNKNCELSQENIADICASFQDAVQEVLVEKAVSACRQHGVDTLCIGGGVSANLCLRERFKSRCKQEGLHFFCPPPQYSTDNGAMIALAGLHTFHDIGVTGFDEDVYSRSSLGF